MRLSNKQKGMCCAILAALGFSGMMALVRLAGDLPSVEKSLFRNLPALLIAGGIMLKNHTSFRVAPENRGVMLGRAACGTVGLLCNFYALDHLLLADATILNKLSPFSAILFSYLFLKERLRLPQLLGVLAAFCGAIMIIRPTGAGLTLLPALSGLCSGMAAGAGFTFIRRMRQNEDSIRIVFYFSLFSCVVTLPFILLYGVPMTARQFFILLTAGLSGAGGQFAVTRAYFYAPANELSVYDYSQLLFATVWGWLLFGQVPNHWSLLGYAVIVGAAVTMFLYNNRFGPFRHLPPEDT